MEIIINKDNFENEVLKSDKPVLLDFWAKWCGPCMMLSPIIEEIAKEYEGKIKVGKINVDENMDLAIKYNVASIPTLFLIKDGKIAKKSIGFLEKAEVIDFIMKE